MYLNLTYEQEELQMDRLFYWYYNCYYDCSAGLLELSGIPDKQAPAYKQSPGKFR